MNLTDDLLALLRCPETGDALRLEGDTLRSERGEQAYPLVSGVPWLLPHPRNSLLDWGAKLHHFRQVLAGDIDLLERELKKAPPVSRDRLQRMRDARQAFMQGVFELVMPIASARVAEKSVYDALRDRAPSTQNLLSYESNLYRDWIWGEEENRRNAELVLELLDGMKPARVFIPGAGSARLAVDLHRELAPGMTVATDINPLLLLAAQRVLSGQDFRLYEFPAHPRDADSIAIEQHFRGLPEWPGNLHLVFADVASPAFEEHAFDLVVTPWLIDIQPFELGRFLRHLNRYLPLGGSWVNFGSLVFNQRRNTYCYTMEEIGEVAAEAGFALQPPLERELPYLRSPHSAGYRVERIWCWRAEKTAHIEKRPGSQVLPGWLLDIAEPIPPTRYFQAFSREHRVMAELAGEVDGKTSIKAIAGRLAKQNNMDREEAAELVRNFFLDLYRQNNPGA